MRRQTGREETLTATKLFTALAVVCFAVSRVNYYGKRTRRFMAVDAIRTNEVQRAVWPTLSYCSLIRK